MQSSRDQVSAVFSHVAISGWGSDKMRVSKRQESGYSRIRLSAQSKPPNFGIPPWEPALMRGLASEVWNMKLA